VNHDNLAHALNGIGHRMREDREELDAAAALYALADLVIETKKAAPHKAGLTRLLTRAMVRRFDAGTPIGDLVREGL